MRFFLISLLFTFSAISAEKPNIILFLIDDMGVMDTSVPLLADDKGQPKVHPLNKFYKTPGMEKLASQGTSFSYFYANSVCSPTRTTLMTGQSSARHRVTQWINPSGKNRGPEAWRWEGLTSKDVTLPGLMKRSGYKTIFCGKAHFGPLKHDGSDPLNLGFDINIAGASWGRPATYYGTKNYGKGRKTHAVPGLEKYHGKEVYLTEALTLEVNKEIAKTVKEKKPFFAYMSHYAVHAPFDPDPRFTKHYKDSDKSKKAQAFATMIEGIDKSLRDMIKQLEELGIAENTIILFVGDNGSDAPLGAIHGYSSSAPLRGKKGTHYEGGTRVPFIAAWAKKADNELQKKFPIKQRLIANEFATVCDIFPTILNYGGAAIPASHTVDGQDISKFFAGENGFHNQKFLMHFPHGHRSSWFTSFHHKKIKLIYHYKEKGDKRYELFDLAKDPYEKNNIASSSPELLASMIKQMNAELTKADALYVKDEDGNDLKPQ